MKVIKHKKIGVEGVCSVISNEKIRVYYGADDGSDDKTISKQEFDANWDIIEEVAD